MTNSTHIQSNHSDASLYVDEIYALKKRLKTQQSHYSNVIRIHEDPVLKNFARSVYNEISKLRRKASQRDDIIELMRISIESSKLISGNFAYQELMVYNALANNVKQRSSRAWKILAGSMIALCLAISKQTNQRINF